MSKLKIFISSVQKEFIKERKTLKIYIEGDPLLRDFFEAHMFEDYPASDIRAADAYLSKVKECDIYLGLFGNDYGPEDKKGLSPTHKEFLEAGRRRCRRLIYVKGKDDSLKNNKMRALILEAGKELIRRRFDTQLELVSAVYASLVKILMESGIIINKPFDASLSQDVSLRDISVEKIRKFLTIAKSERNYPLAPNMPVKDMLAHLDLIKDGKPNNAAVLLFGKKPQRQIPASEVKCMHFHGFEKLKPIPSYQIYKGTLFDLADQSVDFVMSKLNRSVGTRAFGPQAPVEYDIPQQAVAEGIVNAVAHRDYTSKASVEIMLFADRLEIWNPGTLHPPLTIAGLSKPHPSMPPNPLIAEPLFLTKYIEKAGSGIIDMFKQCRQAGTKPPKFRLENGIFILTLWRKNIVPIQSGAQSGAQSDRIIRALIKAPLSMAELINILGLKSKTGAIKRSVGELLSTGYISYSFPDKPNSRLQKYRITKKGLDLLKRLKNH